MAKTSSSPEPTAPPEETGRKKTPLALKDSLAKWFSETPCQGPGDLQAATAAEAMFRAESKSYWTVCGRKLSRVFIMELIVDMVAERHSMLDLLSMEGMPKARTIATWLTESVPFREALAHAEKMRAMLLTDEALDILDKTTIKKAFQDKARADLRMKIAGALDPKKYGKKLTVDGDTLDLGATEKETWDRFRSILVVHADLIQQNTGIRVLVPVQEAEVIDVKREEPRELEMHEIGFQGSLSNPEGPNG